MVLPVTSTAGRPVPVVLSGSLPTDSRDWIAAPSSCLMVLPAVCRAAPVVAYVVVLLVADRAALLATKSRPLLVASRATLSCTCGFIVVLPEVVGLLQYLHGGSSVAT